MRKLMLISMLFCLLIGLTAGNALAFSFGAETIYGTYLGVFGGNDKYLLTNTDPVEALINSATGDIVELSYYGKYDLDSGLDSDGGTLTIESDDDWHTGTWNTGDSGALIQAYMVKAGEEFSLWYLSTALASGQWTSEGLVNGGGKQPQLSHLSGLSASPVPEPATMLLLGVGLIGLAGANRRKIKK